MEEVLSVLPSVPARDAIGHYRCRQSVWERAQKLNVGRYIFTKEGVRDLEIYFDRFEDEPDFEGFLDLAANTRHHGVTFATRRQQAERLYHRCMRYLDERSRSWLGESRSWESLAFLPVDWEIIVKLRRNGVINVATFEMMGDKELLGLKIGLGPVSLKRCRAFCKKALKEQENAAPKVKRVSKPRKTLVTATQLPL